MTPLGAIKQALDAGIVRIFVSTKTPGLKLPEHLFSIRIVTLNLSRRFEYPPEVLEDEIRATLSFHGQNFDCVIPWESILAFQDATGGMSLFWSAASMVEELPEQLLEPAKPRPFTALDGGGDVTPPRTGHLKLLN